MPSADFCTAIGSPRGSPSPESRTRHRPPRLSLPTFVARPPDLQPGPSMDGGLRRVLSARPTRTAYYPIPVRRAATLLHAAFRPHVTVTPLRFANPSPPSRWIRDLHPQVVKHAWQTTIDIGRPSRAVPVTPPGIRVRTTAIRLVKRSWKQLVLEGQATRSRLLAKRC